MCESHNPLIWLCNDSLFLHKCCVILLLPSFTYSAEWYFMLVLFSQHEKNTVVDLFTEALRNGNSGEFAEAVLIYKKL